MNFRKLELEKSQLEKRLQEAALNGEKQMQEIHDLNEEIQRKNGFIEDLKRETGSLNRDLEMLMKQNQELEGKSRLAEAERDQIKAEINPLRRLGETSQAARPPGSPRSSMDVLETRLFRQVGNASKQLEILAKTNAMAQGEKDQLYDQVRKSSGEVNSALRNVMSILEQIALFTKVSANVTAHEATLDGALSELSKLVTALLTEFESLKKEKILLSQETKSYVDQLAQFKSQTDRAKDQTRNATESLSLVEAELGEVKSQLYKLTNEHSMITQTLKTCQDVELPRYREHCVSLQRAVDTLQRELEEGDQKTAAYRAEIEKLRAQCSDLEQNATKTTMDSQQRMQELTTLRQLKSDLLSKLEKQEELTAQVTAKLDETKVQLAVVERAKVAVEENVGKELRNLHHANAELKSQLSALSSGKSSNEERVNRLQSSLRFVEEQNVELEKKLYTKESLYSALFKERQVLAVEKETLEGEVSNLRAY